MVEKELSVRQAEALSRQSQDRVAPAPRAPRGGGGGSKDPDTRLLEQDLSEAIGLQVALDDRDGRGALTIRYETLEQLDDLCHRLTGGRLFRPAD